ncbi:hypothetical protein ACLOJK_028551 [Asimina triloba]
MARQGSLPRPGLAGSSADLQNDGLTIPTAKITLWPGRLWLRLLHVQSLGGGPVTNSNGLHLGKAGWADGAALVAVTLCIACYTFDRYALHTRSRRVKRV